MPKRAPEAPTDVTISIEKDEGGYIGWIVGASPIRGAFVKTVPELPDLVAGMLGSMGYTGAVSVTWVGADEAGKRAAVRLSKPSP